MSPNFKNYTVRVQLSPGVYRFTVTANNSRHLEVLKNLMYTLLCMGMDRIKSLKIQFNYSIFIGLCCLNFISVLTTSHTTTGSINPTSTKMLYLLLLLLYSSVNDTVGIGLGSGLGVSVVTIGIQFVAIIILSCLYVSKKDK